MRKSRRTKPVNWFILGIIFLPAVTIGAYLWATNMISSLENYRSPLQTAPPMPGERVGDSLTSRVVIVILDALRLDTSMDKSVMPTLDQLRSEGASAVMSSQPPSFSAPGWATILTGAWPDINDSQPMNPPDEFSVRAFTQDDIFAAANRFGLKTAVSGYIWFRDMLDNSGVDAGFYTPDEDDAADQEVVNAALPWLESDYQLILIHIDQIDYAGHHEGGPLAQGWDAAAARADALLGIIVSHLNLEQDTLIVLSDHGQIDKGGHGGNEEVTLMEPFVAVGKGILTGIYNKIKMIDIAPTIAVLLGTNIPASSQGQPLLEILNIPQEQRLVILGMLDTQQSALLTAYVNSIGQSPVEMDNAVTVGDTQRAMERARTGRLAQERIWRNMISLFLGFMPVYMIYLRKDKKFLWMCIGALIYFLLFNFRYLLLDRNSYGLSWITGITDFILYTGLTTGVALIIAWFVAMSTLRAFRQPSRRAAGSALGIVWTITYFLLIPVLINFAVNGVTVTWTLPQFTVQYLGFFTLVQSLFVSAIGLILVGLSAFIGKLTQSKP